MRIMTSNIWGDYYSNPVEPRGNQLLPIYKKYNPDILGVQESTKSWQNSSLFKSLSEDYNAVGYDNKFNINFETLFYKNTYKLIANGFEYLDDTPDISKGITWAVLKNPQDNKSFAVCNTHFWFKEGPEHDEIRVTNAKQISSLMKYLSKKYSCPSFMFGDLNCYTSSECFKTLVSEGLVPLYDIAEQKDDKGTYHGYPKKDENGVFRSTMTDHNHDFALDHILGYGGDFKVSKYAVVEDQDALDATDHNPVYADIEF